MGDGTTEEDPDDRTRFLQPCPIELQKPFYANEMVHTLQLVSMQPHHFLTPGHHCGCSSFEVTQSSMGTRLTHTQTLMWLVE